MQRHVHLKNQFEKVVLYYFIQSAPHDKISDFGQNICIPYILQNTVHVCR